MATDLSYSTLDRLVHRIVFGAPGLQMTAADIENAVFGSTYRHLEAARPIFITSLPRAGTTVLLEALHLLPGLATHLYRDMPLVMAPILWSKLSGPFRKSAEMRERAHGDGLRIGFDSPEAFEEVLWMSFWPKKYANDGIALWAAEDFWEEVRDFFRDHMRKIIALRHPSGGRYISKNNGNIARLDLLLAMFTDAQIVVPVRRPVDHAASLLRQHLNFLKRHAEDAFTQRYMADIGHFEFGALHRPIDFPGLAELVSGRDPLSLEYWLGYWIAAFEHVLTRADRLILISHDEMRRDPSSALERLCDVLGIDARDGLAEAARMFRGAPAATKPEVSCSLRDRAESLHADLMAGVVA